MSEETEKISIDVYKTTIEKKEIPLPYFSRNSIFFYKVVDPSKAVQVNTSSLSGPEILKVHSGLAFGDNCEPCTEIEFVNAFNETLAKLNELMLYKLSTIEPSNALQ